jgi:hypothetical protein
MKTYEEMINTIEPFSKYLTMTYGKKEDKNRAGVTTFNFDKDGKRYRILPINNVPNCCGAKMFISTDVIPVEILNNFCRHLMPCGEMLIFIMPNLPSMANKIWDGVGVASMPQKKDISYGHVYVTIKTLPYFSLEAGFRKRPVNNQAVSVIRLSEKVYFFHSLDDYAGRLKKVRAILGAKDKDNIILAISVPQQDGDRPTRQELQLAYTCINPKTNRTLQLYSTVVGPAATRLTLWTRFKLCFKRFMFDT